MMVSKYFQLSSKFLFFGLVLSVLSSGCGKCKDDSFRVSFRFVGIWLEGFLVIGVCEEGLSDLFPIFDFSLKVFELEGLDVKVFLELLLGVVVFSDEFVMSGGEFLVFSLKLGIGWVLMREGGETIVVFFELGIGGSELGDFLGELLILVKSFFEKFSDERKMLEEAFLGFA
jgi:hypothetical protein